MPNRKRERLRYHRTSRTKPESSLNLAKLGRESVVMKRAWFVLAGLVVSVPWMTAHASEVGDQLHPAAPAAAAVSGSCPYCGGHHGSSHGGSWDQVWNWLTYRPAHSCGCHSCAPCCYAPLYTYFLGYCAAAPAPGNLAVVTWDASPPAPCTHCTTSSSPVRASGTCIPCAAKPLPTTGSIGTVSWTMDSASDSQAPASSSSKFFGHLRGVFERNQ
jgi:hypothetical protein